MRTYIDYLQDMLDAANDALDFASGLNYEAFIINKEKIYATIRTLEIIGKAAKKIPKSIKERYPNMPWSKAAGMRDLLIHSYFGTSYEKVWFTVQNELPSLRKRVEETLLELKIN